MAGDMKDIEVLLVQAWKLALLNDNRDLAEAIVSLPGLFEKKKPAVVFRIPSGKYRGRSLDQLADYELQNVWAGFNGCGNVAVANILRAEIDRRR